MRINKKMLAAAVLFFGIAAAASAQGLAQSGISAITSAYRLYKDMPLPALASPTVVEIPVNDAVVERYDFAVRDLTDNSFEPYVFKNSVIETPVTLNATPYAGSAALMADSNTRTYADFPLPDNTQGYVQIVLTSSAPITSSALTVLLDNNVALPSTVEIRAQVDGQDRIVLASRRMFGQTVRFPQTTSSRWTVSFTFNQPLRISELHLVQDSAAQMATKAVRFLAQPSHSYRLYLDPDRAAPAPVGEAGNLASAKEVVVIPPQGSVSNQEFVPADIDGDGVVDTGDNCVSVANPSQEDLNQNGRGDACDDFDQDGIINSRDNCPDKPNISQADADSDGIGDVCDSEESRVTERYAWIPWAGIGFAALVLVTLLALTAKSAKTPAESVPPDDLQKH